MSSKKLVFVLVFVVTIARLSVAQPCFDHFCVGSRDIFVPSTPTSLGSIDSRSAVYDQHTGIGPVLVSTASAGVSCQFAAGLVYFGANKAGAQETGMILADSGNELLLGGVLPNQYTVTHAYYSAQHGKHKGVMFMNEYACTMSTCCQAIVDDASGDPELIYCHGDVFALTLKQMGASESVGVLVYSGSNDVQSYQVTCPTSDASLQFSYQFVATFGGHNPLVNVVNATTKPMFQPLPATCDVPTFAPTAAKN
jgi:hypothetical protein